MRYVSHLFFINSFSKELSNKSIFSIKSVIDLNHHRLNRYHSRLHKISIIPGQIRLELIQSFSFYNKFVLFFIDSSCKSFERNPKIIQKPKFGKLVPLHPVGATTPNGKGIALRFGPGGYAPFLLPRISEASKFLALEGGSEYEWNTNINLKL